jgi:hypothetical protein
MAVQEADATADGLTEEQRAWTREAMSRLGVEHGDWLVLQGAQESKREALGDAVEAVLAEVDARCQILAMPAGIEVDLVPAEAMAQKHRWMQKELDANALMKKPVPSLMEGLKVSRPILRIKRLRVREGDAVVVRSAKDAAAGLDEARGTVAGEVRDAMDRQGLSGLVVNLPPGMGLDDLEEDKMMDAGWTRIERTER